MRHALGIDKLMWGSDYPHIEGSWPQTKEWIHSAFEGVPETEIRLMLGENAVDCYGLEDETLRKIADRVGPAPGEL
jgi:predicted TIM-barrel fold metal-dependent hydrolase